MGKMPENIWACHPLPEHKITEDFMCFDKKSVDDSTTEYARKDLTTNTKALAEKLRGILKTPLPPEHCDCDQAMGFNTAIQTILKLIGEE